MASKPFSSHDVKTSPVMKFKHKLRRSFRRAHHQHHKHVNSLKDITEISGNDENIHYGKNQNDGKNPSEGDSSVQRNSNYWNISTCNDGRQSQELTCSKFDDKISENLEIPGIKNKSLEEVSKMTHLTEQNMSLSGDSVSKNSIHFSVTGKPPIGHIRQCKKSDVKLQRKDKLNKRLQVAAKSGFLANLKDTLDFSSLVRSVSFSKKFGKQTKNAGILKSGPGDEICDEIKVTQPVCEHGNLQLTERLTQSSAKSLPENSCKQPVLNTLTFETNFNDSLPFEVNTDLSPTCADIYGVDEVDNALFHKSVSVNEIQQNSNLIQNVGKAKDKATENVDCNSSLSVKTSPSDNIGIVNKTEDWIKFCNGINLDKQHETIVSESGSNQTGDRMDHRTFHGKDHGTEHITDHGKNHSMCNENPWVKKVDDLKFQDVKLNIDNVVDYHIDLTDDILETSLGFDVNTLTKRSGSVSSLDSFASAVSEISAKDIFFSDSEAEHNVNDTAKLSSDSDTGHKKQIIPYSLAENVAKQNVTVRKKKRHKDLHSKSFDDNSPMSPKDLTKVSLFKSISLGWNEEKVQKNKHMRRSLDSSLMAGDYQNGELSSQWKKSIKTGSAEFLSPVLENKVTKDAKNDHKSSDKGLDPTRFFTLPNPKKLRSQQREAKRKSGRLSSVSKILSDKAQSWTNLKMGASFKIRKEIEKSKSLVSSSANSLSDMMTKKASSLTTLIRRRTHSNSAVASPFKQYGKKRTITNNEDQSELVYEKVSVKVPPKRQATALEELTRLKRLKVTLKLARTLSLNEDENKYIDSRSRSSSMVGRPLNSSSSSSLRSPTFLDELMKSVESARVKQLCSVGDNDSILSEESSSGSSSMLFQKQYSFDSEGTDCKSVRDSSLISVCRSCGKLRSLSSTESFESPSNKPTIASSRYAMSLCDLNSKCVCSNRKQVDKRYSAVLDGDKLSLTEHFSANRSSSGMIASSDSSQMLTCSSRATNRTRSSLSGQRPSSMHDIRGRMFTDWDYEKSMNSLDETDGIDTSDAIPGALHRHRPLLDLSGENLDVTIDSEDGIISPVDDEYAKRSQSCGDLIDSDKYFGKSIPLTEIAKSMGMKNQPEFDSESINSCSESGTTDKDCNEILNDSEELSRSCSDLIDSKGDDYRSEEQRKKELRKVKVKSMSSSHDALSVLVPMETINIDDIDFDSCLNQNSAKDIKSESPKCVKVGNNDEKVDSQVNENSNVTKNDANIFANEENETISSSNVCDNKEPSLNSQCHDKLGFKPVRDKATILSSKPPLPHRPYKNRVLSLTDLADSNNTENNSDIPKRYSMIELDKENLTSPKWVSDIDIVKKQKQKRRRRTVLGMSDELNTPRSAGMLRTPVSKFLFDENQVESYLKTVSVLDRPKSASSDHVNTAGDGVKNTDRSRIQSARSLRQLSTQTSASDDVFNRLSFPSGIPFTPFADIIESTTEKQCYSNLSGVSDYLGFTSSGHGHLPELSTLTEDCVYKYDICLGYLLHSLQCDNMIVCFYSPQRNKQLMESVITPLSATPRTPQRTSGDHGNTGKIPNKPNLDELPNPAAPITSVPSERLVHAGHVLRTVMLARAPHMIRDRKFHLRTYRRCMVGTEMVDWLMQQSTLVHSRTQAVGMWQALVEEGLVVHVCHEHQFKDKYLFYRFQEDDEGVGTAPSNTTKRECEEDLPDIFLMLAHKGPDAMMRMILRKLPHERTSEDLEIIYEELLHIKALSHLSTMVKRELASVLLFESHAKAGTVLFNQGDEGKSWYIVLKGSVNVVIYGKGVVCTLHEGDDFGKLALVNDAPRAATIVLRDNNCHFLRVDKDDFNRILRDVEANTVRLKEHGQDVLVLEKIPSNTQCTDGTVHSHYKYSVMAGTPEKMLEHLLESRLDNKHASEIDEFLEDFLLTHVIFMPCNHLCPVLLSHYHSSTADVTEQESLEFMLNHKRCVLHFVEEWANIVGVAFNEDYTINAFLEELNSCVMDDLQDYPSLKDDIAALDSILSAHKGSPNHRMKKQASGSSTMLRKSSKECFQDSPKKRKSISASQETIIKVYCADHTYTTVKILMDATVEQILTQVKDKLGLGVDLILCEVKSTGERLVFKENDLGITTSLSINSHLFVTPKEHLDALTPLPEQTGLSEGTFSVIEMFSSREMAYHMTIYDWELFTCVQEYELIYQVFGRYKFGKITCNLDLFLRRFNEIQFWIVTEMVLTSNLSKRVSLLRKFIKLAAHCKEYRNLNCFFAIVMGLSNIAVSRLSLTWEKLPGKFKKMFADFETLMDPSRNHRVYRLSVAKMAPPIIPFMPLLMKDMTFTHEGNKTYFDGLINFEKMHMIAQTLKTVRFCRSTRLDIEAPGTVKSSDTADYIRNIKVIDNQRMLTQLSYKLEPRRT